MGDDLFQRLELEIEIHRSLDGSSGYKAGHCLAWLRRLESEPRRMMNSDGTLAKENLRNFWRQQIFLKDVPQHDIQALSLKNLLGGGRRGERKKLIECLTVLEESGYCDLLKKYPCPSIGNPNVFRYKGYIYTYQWFKHIYLVGLLEEVLGKFLGGGFVGLDIGSGYGTFSALAKKRWPSSHHVLVDFPEELILAYYFLGSFLPEARIAGAKEIEGKTTLTRSFLEQYDFVLVPIPFYERLAAGSVDLVTNFTSFAEMKRRWFDYYTKSTVFTTAKFFFTANRIQSYPVYDTDVTILDYPIWDPEKRIHFRVPPSFMKPYTYSRQGLFFSKKVPHAPLFEYVGRI